METIGDDVHHLFVFAQLTKLLCLANFDGKLELLSPCL